MSLERLKNIIPKTNDMKSTYSNEVTRNINAFLNFLCLSSITLSKNEIVRGTSFARFFLFITCYIIAISFSIMLRSLRPIVEVGQMVSLRVYINAATLFVAQLLVIANFLTCYRSKDFAAHQEYFSNYLTLDRVLKVPSLKIASRKKNLESMFFVIIGLNTLKMVGEFVWKPEYVDHIVAMFVIIITMMNLLTKLMVLQDKFECYVEDVVLAMKNLKTKERIRQNIVQTVKKYKRCYQLIYKQMFIIHQVHGWQVSRTLTTNSTSLKKMFPYFFVVLAFTFPFVISILCG